MSLTADTEKAVSHSTHGIADAQGVSKTAPKTHPSPDIKTDKKDDATKEDDKLSTELAAREAAKHKTLGDAWGGLKESAGNLFLNVRERTIRATPRFIVNNSSNILGAAHVATEVMMTKSSIKGAELAPGSKNLWDWLVKAGDRVFIGAYRDSKNDISVMSEMMKEKPVKGFFQYVTDSAAATNREIQTQFPDGVLGKTYQERAAKLEQLSLEQRTVELDKLNKLKLGNPWQTRSTLVGLVVWSLSAIIPDKKESSDEVERMAVKQKTDLLGYIGERLKQAVWFPDWGAHKRQMIGLGYAIIGICSMFGAWRNSIKPSNATLSLWKSEPSAAAALNLPQCPTHEFNKGYFATSVLSFLSSIPMLFAVDDQKAFSGFGSMMAGRLLFLPGSIKKKLGVTEGTKRGAKKLGEDGAMYYLGATAAFQAENLAQALIGGAEKHRDGTVVDHEEIKRRAYQEAIQIKAERKRLKTHEDRAVSVDSDVALPNTKISSISSAELAMPERREAVLEAASAANV